MASMALIRSAVWNIRTNISLKTSHETTNETKPSFVIVYDFWNPSTRRNDDAGDDSVVLGSVVFDQSVNRG